MHLQRYFCDLHLLLEDGDGPNLKEVGVTKNTQCFDLATDIVTHIETGRVDHNDKFMLILAARRLLSGLAMTPQQTSIWSRYVKG